MWLYNSKWDIFIKCANSCRRFRAILHLHFSQGDYENFIKPCVSDQHGLIQKIRKHEQNKIHWNYNFAFILQADRKRWRQNSPPIGKIIWLAYSTGHRNFRTWSLYILTFIYQIEITALMPSLRTKSDWITVSILQWISSPRESLATLCFPWTRQRIWADFRPRHHRVTWASVYYALYTAGNYPAVWEQNTIIMLQYEWWWYWPQK